MSNNDNQYGLNMPNFNMDTTESELENISFDGLNFKQKRDIHFGIVTLINKHIIMIKALDKVRLKYMEDLDASIDRDTECAEMTIDEDDVILSALGEEEDLGKKMTLQNPSHLENESSDEPTKPVKVEEAKKKSTKKKATDNEITVSQSKTVDDVVKKVNKNEITVPVKEPSAKGLSEEKDAKKKPKKKAVEADIVVSQPVVIPEPVSEEKDAKKKPKKKTVEVDIVASQPVVIPEPVSEEKDTKKKPRKKAVEPESQVQVPVSVQVPVPVPVPSSTSSTEEKDAKKKPKKKAVEVESPAPVSAPASAASTEEKIKRKKKVAN